MTGFSSMAFLVSQGFVCHNFVVMVGVVPTWKHCIQLILMASERWKMGEALCTLLFFLLLLWQILSQDYNYHFIIQIC